MHATRINRDQDYYAWLIQQRQDLIDENLDEIDMPNIAKEFDHLIEHEREIELRDRLQGLLLCLIKWAYDPISSEISGPCWRMIASERPYLIGTLLTSPSLKPYLKEMITQGYDWAKKRAAKQLSYSVARFPETCPWTQEEILDLDFWPKAKK